MSHHSGTCTHRRGLFRSILDKGRKFRLSTAGSAAVLVGLMSPVLVGAMGLGGEAGYWYLTKRKVQNAADVAAHATAIRMNEGDDLATLQALAEYVISESEVSLTASVVQLNQPPTEGDFIEDGAAIEIVVTQTVPRMFSAIYSTDPITITARAVATAVGGGQGCLLALNEVQDGALTIDGSSVVTLLNCEAVSNAAGVSVDMPSDFSTTISDCIRGAGTVNLNIAVTLTCDGPVENISPVDDPLSGLAEPAITGTCESSWEVGDDILPTVITPTEAHPSGMNVIRYCNGLSLTGNVVLNPGLYIIEPGPDNSRFKINSSSVVIGTGVMFYLADGVEVQWNGAATITLSPPIAGDYTGVTLFGSRDETTDELHRFNGNAATVLDGTFYTPTSDARFSGGGGTSFTSCTQVIADTILFTGSSIMTLHCLFPPAAPIIEVAGEATVVE